MYTQKGITLKLESLNRFCGMLGDESHAAGVEKQIGDEEIDIQVRAMAKQLDPGWVSWIVGLCGNNNT